MAQRAKTEAVVDEPVDDNLETEHLTGEVGEAELQIARAVAKRMGWAPKEEWTRDPAKWQDAPQFLENTPKVIDRLKETADRSARAAAEAIEEDRRRAREEAQRVIRESDDPEERDKAAKRLADAAGPPPETQAWVARNPWFQTDSRANALAVATANEAAKRGASISDQLKEAEAEVKRRYPEHFGEPARLSEVRARPAPQVQGGTRSGTTTQREKGFSDLPSAARDAFERHLLRTFTNRGLSKQEAEKRYAMSYWRERAKQEAE